MTLHDSLSSAAGDWQSKVAEKRVSCQKAIPQAWTLPTSILESLPASTDLAKTKINLMSLDIPRRSGILTERELEITESFNVPSLLEGLASGKLTSLEVTLAYSKRAAIAQQLTNCLTETFFERAQERARHLDDLRSEGKLAGPLHGLPVSLKDTYQVEGTQATIGAAAFLDRTSKENSALVNILLGLGAVLYVKTNVSQVLMTVESDNNVFGRVLNPWNTMLTAGGSSGGEGALVAFRGSPLGVGTDLAGSIRIPSLCCGTYGFKPTAGRIAYGGQVMPLNAGIGAILPSAGPFANDMEALRIFMKAIIEARPFRHDPTAIDVPWRNIDGSPRSKLRLGLLAEDPLFPLQPPVKETVVKAVELLRSHGHEIVVLDPAECHVAAANQIAGGLLSLDSTPGEIIASSGEPIVPSMRMFAEQMEKIDWDFVPDLSAMDSLQKFGTLQNKRAQIIEAWQRVWVKHDIDAVIAPSAQNTAVEHDKFGWPAYSTFLNALDYPACIIPFGKAGNCEVEFTIKPGQGTPAYNSEIVDGAPCSIQIFTSRMRDEECLEVAAVVDACLRDNAN
ncbi:amidase signature domain-containing protein [Dactylonectria estremocensis]|uniref:amidase n=1 Tax=Dactylonectria estremocensis TaxID=1079267 RepID=A0A9P9EIZ1_9HYPO|nr:amidase signature domain-containing protein [Dactylonectria estremocensis]